MKIMSQLDNFAQVLDKQSTNFQFDVRDVRGNCSEPVIKMQ